MTHLNLAGKTIIITGASRGIGRAIALRCARDGANIVIASKTVDDTAQKLKGTIFDVAREVEAAGGQALPLQVDVRDDARIAWMVAQTVERFGGVDALVNNAGAIMLQPTELLPIKRFDLVFGLNVRAVFCCSQACIPYLKKSANGHILNLSPPISLQERWFQKHTPYATSKFAMTMLAYGTAAELKHDGVAANTLWPRTLIATAAVEWLGGESLMLGSRKPEIMADAAHWILTRPSRECTGRFFIDDEALKEAGVTDLSGYSVVPGAELAPDFFVPTPGSKNVVGRA